MEHIQFKIHGKDRRLLKKELHKYKRVLKNFWYYHQLNKDMALFYGGTDLLLTDREALEKFNTWTDNVNKIEQQLAERYEKEN